MTDREGQTALYSAAGRGWTKVVAFMIEHSANVDVADKRGKSPLDIALTPVGGRPRFRTRKPSRSCCAARATSRSPRNS